MPVIAIDPGPEYSALVVWDGEAVTYKAYASNADILTYLRERRSAGEPLAIEKVVSYGMSVGADVFETVYWSGRFAEAYGADLVVRIPRLDIKVHLCRSARAKDGNIRQALIDRFGQPGTKKQPGALWGISSHLWAALAVAVTYHDQNVTPRLQNPEKMNGFIPNGRSAEIPEIGEGGAAA